jgi:hypothetical protein
MVKKTPLQRKKLLTNSQKNRLKSKKHREVTLTLESAGFWDKKLSKVQNYAKYGILSTPNLKDDVKKSTQYANALEDIPIEKIQDLPAPGEELGSKFEKWKVSKGEQLFLKDLDEKYGDDFDKMAFDMKLNPYQLTATQIRKKMKKYKEFLEIEKSRVVNEPIKKEKGEKKKRKKKNKMRLREKLL